MSRTLEMVTEIKEERGGEARGRQIQSETRRERENEIDEQLKA